MNRVDWGRILTILEIIYVAAIIYFLLMSRTENGPAAMRFWHTIGTVCRGIAYTAGRAGIHAERSYWAAVERARG